MSNPKTMPDYPEEDRLLIERGLSRYFPTLDYPDVITKAMGHSLFSGGKRFRGVLTIEAARTFGASPESVLPTACAIEYIHTYSLIHDDLPAIDDDEMRRGQPTCHVLFGEDIAILAGDALFAEAFNLIASEQDGEPVRVLRVIREIASASGVRGMVGGQVADVLSTGKAIDEGALRFIEGKKTGELITAALRAGAVLAGASEGQIQALSRYGRDLGLAFQITDDILDVIGDSSELGKRAGGDERHRKPTMPSVVGLERARAAAKSAVHNAKLALAGLEHDASVLEGLADFVYERRC